MTPLAFLALAHVAFALTPSCTDFQGGSANKPVDLAKVQKFTAPAIIQSCNVVDSARFEKTIFEKTLTVSNSDVDGAAILYSQFEDALAVVDSTWNNVRLDGSGFQKGLSLERSTAHFSEAVGAYSKSLRLTKVQSQFFSLASSHVESLAIVDANITRLWCDSALLQDASITGSAIDELNFDSGLSSSFVIADSKVRGGFASASFHHGADEPVASGSFGGLRLSGTVDISYSNFDGADMSTTLVEADAGVTARYSSFIGAVLRGSDLRGIDARNANFSRADLRGVDLRGADLRRADLTDALTNNETDFEGARLDDVEGVHLGGVCFPAAATVVLEGGVERAVADVKVGDRVRTGGVAGGYSAVFAFTHREATVRSVFVELEVGGGGKVVLTPSHYVYANGALLAAREVGVGDVLSGWDGRDMVVRGRRQVVAEGLFNPQTLSGDIVVDNVRCSCYTEAVPPALAHVVLLFDRAAYVLLGRSFIGRALEHHSPAVQSVVRTLSVFK